MAYHGYVPLVKQYIASLKKLPCVLEVGVDRGVTFIPLTAFLARLCPQFYIVGVDIKVQESVKLTVANVDLMQGQAAFLIEGNSLDVLPKLLDQKMTFDVVMLDGDHNYHTVSRELELLQEMTHDHSIIVVDDYDGRWSDRDLWYAERPGYEDVKIATKPVDTEKHGVKAAVDEFVESHSEWTIAKPIKGEPVLLMRNTSIVAPSEQS